MKNCFLILIIAISLGGCTKSIQTEIPGLDLSKPQDSRYFHANYDASLKFVDWCQKTMLPPIPKDKTSQMFYRNCLAASWAVKTPPKKFEQPASSYKRY